MNKKDLVVSMFFLLVSFLIFLPMFISDKIFSWLDFTYYFLPFRQLTSEIIKSGVMPLWNPYIYCGNPLMANMQSAVFYPLNVLYYVLPFVPALKLQTLLAFFIASFSMYAFIRSYNTRRLAAVLGASVFAFGFYLTVRAVEMADLHVIIWMPAVLLAARRYALYNRLHDMFLLVLCLSMSFLGGHPQVFSYVFVLFTAFYFYEAMTAGGKFTEMLKKYFMVTGCFAAAVLLQLLPTAEFVILSKRASEGVGANVHLSTFAGAGQALAFFFPFLSDEMGRQEGFLNWMGLIDIGAPAIMLFIAGIFVLKNNRLKVFIFSLFAAAALIAFAGNFKPYRILLDLIPALGAVEYVSKINLICLAAISLICAFTFEELFRPGLPHKKAVLAFFGVSLMVLILSVIFFAMRGRGYELIMNAVFGRDSMLRQGNIQELSGVFLKNMLVYAAFLFLIAAVLLYAVLSGKALNTAAYSVFILAFLALFSRHTAGYDFYADGSIFFDDTENTAMLKKQKGTNLTRVLAPYSSNRFDYSVSTANNEASVYYIRESLFPNIPMQERILNADGFDSLEIASFYALKKRIQSLDNPWENPAFSLLSAEYIISQSKLKGRYIKPLSAGFSSVYKYEKAMPMVYFVPAGNGIMFASDGTEALDRISSNDFRPDTELYLEKNAEPVFSRMTPGKGHGKVMFAMENINTFAIDAVTESDGAVVITDNFYPGWVAKVNGIKAPVFRANHTFKAIPVKKGNNEIRLEFKPKSQQFSALLSVLFIFVGGVFAIKSFVSARRYAQ